MVERLIKLNHSFTFSFIEYLTISQKHFRTEEPSTNNNKYVSINGPAAHSCK